MRGRFNHNPIRSEGAKLTERRLGKLLIRPFGAMLLPQGIIGDRHNAMVAALREVGILLNRGFLLNLAENPKNRLINWLKIRETAL